MKIKSNFSLKYIFCIIIIIISGCNNLSSNNSLNASDIQNQTSTTSEITPYRTEAQVIAVGDIMMHMAQIQSGYDAQTNTYSYPTFFKEVEPILSQGDWVIGNLETTLAGLEANYSGYPLFNAPESIADSMKDAGFNIISTTNNHSLDRGEIGVLNTLKNLQERGLIPVGTYASAEDKAKILMVEKNEINMAILAYTYGTNGISVPDGKDYLVSFINEAQIIEDITQAKAENADVVTVILHFGNEYERYPNQQQKDIVESLVEAGADIILGSHPHVVQPYEMFEINESNGEIRKAVAIYSMGNFISYQIGNYKDLGVIFKVHLEKDFPSEEIEITGVEAIPTYIQNYRLNNRLNFRVLPLEETLKTQDDSLISPQQYSLFETYLNQMNTHLSSMN